MQSFGGFPKWMVLKYQFEKQHNSLILLMSNFFTHREPKSSERATIRDRKYTNTCLEYNTPVLLKQTTKCKTNPYMLQNKAVVNSHLFKGSLLIAYLNCPTSMYSNCFSTNPINTWRENKVLKKYTTETLITIWNYSDRITEVCVLDEEKEKTCT